jgi:amino acid adenylation domain-containing protein
MTLLHELVSSASTRSPEAPAIRAPDGALNYVELDGWSNRVARALQGLGVSPADRVALWGEKSWRLVAAMQGALRLGAAYVPIAASVPAARAAAMLADCGVRCVVTDRTRLARLICTGADLPAMLVDDWATIANYAPDPVAAADLSPEDLAYILYTSGSTGRPKGVCISHRNAMAFVEWAAHTARIDEHSRLANHAAFNFDLSVFDLYAAFAGRGCVSIVPEALSFSPVQLAEFIRREQVTVWYSVPSALVLLIQQGKLLEHRETPLKTIIFAGEIFPIRFLRALREAWPHVTLWNMYGPTETNVCTAYEVRDIAPDRTAPMPIGRACAGDRVWLADANGQPIEGSEEGELIVDGPTVMLGYWGGEHQSGRSYATGDICRRDPDGNLVYVGRADQMVKIRGHRVELGDVESTLGTYPGIADVAAVVLGEGVDARLVAFFVTKASPPPTLIDLKTHCAARVPAYMVINLAWRLDELPRTPNGKVDRRRLSELAREFVETNAPEERPAVV